MRLEFVGMVTFLLLPPEESLIRWEMSLHLVTQTVFSKSKGISFFFSFFFTFNMLSLYYFKYNLVLCSVLNFTSHSET